MRYIKWIVAVLIVIVLGTGLVLGHTVANGGKSISTITKTPSKKASLEELRTVNPFTGNDPLHIAVFGVDRTATTDMDEEENPSRSDTIMLFTIDPVTKRAQLLSLPRDTYLHAPGHSGKTKLGHAYAYGGHELAVETIEEFMDVNIDYYATVDYAAVKRLVDAVGGIEVDIPFDYEYEDTYVVPNLHINFKKGRQRLDGEDAVRYLRIRKIYENQDIGRIQAQQGFLMSIFQQLKHPSIIFKIPELIDIVQDNVETDLSYGQIAYLARFGLEMDRENIVTDTLVGTDQYIGDIAYYVVDQANAREQLRRFLNGKGSYYEEVTQGSNSQEEETENNTSNSNNSNNIEEN